MHITKLEICGFKSFVDRTVIHFDHDVIGVVGPNGCGKSNIVDALRWCMGEQSPRQLRGRSMEDVIFAGSESRPVHGFAEVTISFANDDPERAMSLPLEYRDYHEIAVTRRLYRDGTSEYLINRVPVRLKDVTDLFLGTGVGTKAYSIVEQGKIGMIVSAKPEDRRLLIEEAAGITKYKYRKRQAEKKMDLTRQNLLRVGDIVAEIERNLSSLKRQASKAERYLGYRKQLDDLVLHEAAHKLLEIVAVEKVSSAARAEAEEAASRGRAELDAHDARLQAARAEAVQLERRTDEAQEAAFLADNEVRALEAETQRGRDRLGHLGDRAAAAVQEADRLRAQREALAQEREAMQSSLVALERAESEESEGLEAEQARLEGLEAEQRAAEAAAAELRRAGAQASAEAAAARERLGGFDRRVADMGARRERLAVDRERLSQDARELESGRAQLVSRSRQAAEAEARSATEVEAFGAQMQALRESMVLVDREIEAAKADLSQHRGRHRALQELHDSFQGVGAGPRAILEMRDPCVVGLVADLLEAPEALIEPFAALLGNSLQDVVVRDLARGAELLGELSRRKAGRAVLVSANPAYVAAAHGPVPVGRGVVGPIVDQLLFAPEREVLVRSLTGDALLVETDEVAADLRGAGERRTLVTLAGTVYMADGRIGGGGGDHVAAGLLRQKRQLRELGLAIGAKQASVDALVAAHADVRQRMTATGELLDAARAGERQAELARVNADGELRRLEDSTAALSARLGEIAAEAGELDRGLAEAGLERQSAERGLALSQVESERIALEVERAQGETREQAARVAAHQTVCTERKISFARVREQASSARAAAERLARSIEELGRREGELEADATQAAAEQGRTAADLFALGERLSVGAVAASAARDAFDGLRKALDGVRNALGVHEAEIRSLRAEVEQLEQGERAQAMALQRLELERDHLLEDIARRFQGLRLPSVVGDYHMRAPPDERHRARIQELGGLIDRMGPVNLDAMGEYEKAAERHQFYSTQKADLEKALADLERAIQQMNRESRRLFRTTFDSVNERFQAIFPRMFCGGRASLVLTDPDDLLETGVDIVAQPPGKKIGSIELMSGGEKALTAVSLIFAIFQHKPSPFCVLDEVDASLDEANVARYADMIRAMTSRSQFILITHVKRTMQAVDVLYGVTMQEPGVSRLVSVKVNAAAVARSQAPVEEAVA
jgi:chromosome segregation protein